METLIATTYLISAICFILALKGLASPTTARRGNYIGMVGMTLAITATLANPNMQHELKLILEIVLGGIIGTVIALRIKMTAMPQLVAAFHSLVGMAAVLVAGSALLSPESFGIGHVYQIHLASLIEMSLGLIIGAITFSGSIIALLKLQALISGKPVRFMGQHSLNALLTCTIIGLTVYFCQSQSHVVFAVIAALSFLIGFLLIIPIGGADMPVVISMLNSYSGWAAAGIGFTLSNALLIITGALVGASGAILSYIMCKAMNRSIINVVFGGFGTADQGVDAQQGTYNLSDVKQGSAEDAAFLLKQAKDVIVVPGYGLAVAQAQHAVKELTDALQQTVVKVRFAIHPVAGRMPGHMNVLLAEANVPYTLVFEQQEINRDFATADVAIVIGANDITNPAAKSDASSPIYGMPILEVAHAKQVLFLKRSLAPGYAGVQNELFFRDNTMMLFGDAKQMVENIVKALTH